MTGDAELYPQYCHHLAPTFRQWCLMHTSLIHGLSSRYDVFERQNVFFHRNLPIHYARIVGVIVAIDDFQGRRVFTIDDSSGACIECNVQFKTKPAAVLGDGTARAYSFEPPEMIFAIPECASLDVGNVVDLKGSLSTFRDEMTIQILRAKILRSTEEEVALWERRTKFLREVLEEPWVLTERRVRRCLREAEEDKRRKEKKTKGVREKTKGTDELESAKAPERQQERPKALEPEVDGFGRPKRPKTAPGMPPPAQIEPRSHKRRPEGAQGLAGRTTLSERSHSAPVELDGFGRPKRPKRPAHSFKNITTRRREDSEPAETSRASSRGDLDESTRGRYSALGL